MDMKIIITFVALYFTETARAQHGDLSALLGLASGNAGGSSGSCPLGEHPNKNQFIQGKVVKTCPGNTIFDPVVCSCNFKPTGSNAGGGSLGLTNLLSGSDIGGGIPGSSGAGGLADILGAGPSGGGLAALLSANSGGGGLSDLLAAGSSRKGTGSRGGLSDLLSGGSSSSSSGGLRDLLSGGSSRKRTGSTGGINDLLSRSSSGSRNSPPGGSLSDLLSGGGGGLASLLSGEGSSGRGGNAGGGGLSDLLSGGGTSTGSGRSGSALDALLNQLTSQQGDLGTPIHPTPKSPPRRKPEKSSRARDALQRILDRTSGSKPSSLMGRSKKRDRSPRPSRDPPSSSNRPGDMPSALYDILQNGNRKRPTNRPPPKIVPKSRSSRRRPPWPPSTAPPRRRQSSRRRGPPPAPSSGRPSLKPPTSRPRPTRPSRPRSGGRSQDSFNQLLKQLGMGNRPSSSGGRRRDGVGGRQGGLADLQRTLSGGRQGGPFGSQQGTSEMARLLAAIEGPGGLGGGGGIPLGIGGALGGGAGGIPGLDRILSGLSGGLGAGGLGSAGAAGALGGASAMLGSQVPDLTSILNRRGAMMPLAGGNMNSLRNLNPMTLASLDRAGLVDVSDLTPQGLMALGTVMG